MKLTNKILYTLGGAAVSASAIYYIYQKVKQALVDPTYHLNNFKEQFYRLPSSKLDKMEQKFHHLVNYVFGKQIMTKQNENHQNIHKYCRNIISNDGFYECLTCYEAAEVNIKDISDDMHLFSVNQFCMDCFDHQYHKGHKYSKKQFEGNFQCDCGNPSNIPETAFCKLHESFDEQSQSSETTNDDSLKQLCIQFFRQAFYILIDQQADYIYQCEKGYNKERHQMHFNKFLQIIINKMQQMISDNPQFINIFAELFQTPFIKPTRVDINQKSFKILKTKTLDSNTSILEYLIKMQGFMNDKNSQDLYNLLNDLTMTNDQLQQFATLQLLKMVQLSLYVFENTIDNQSVITIKQTQLFEIFLKGLRNKQHSYNLIINNQSDYINSIKHINSILQNIQFTQSSDYRIIYISSIILSQVVQNPLLFQENNLIEAYIEELINLHSLVFDKLLLKQMDSSDSYYQQFINNYPLIMGLFEIQKILLVYFKLFVIRIRQLFSKEERCKILNIIWQSYYNKIQIEYYISTIFREQNDEELLHCSSVLVSLIVYIIALSEDSVELTSNKIKKILKDQFENNEDDGQYNQFVKMVSYLMQNNMFQCYEYPSSYWRWYLESISHQEQQFSVLHLAQENWKSPSNQLYDHFMMAQQIISLINEDDESSLLTKQVRNFIETPNLIDSSSTEFEFTETYFISVLILQTIFDQTPFLNIFGGQQNVFFGEQNKKMQDQIDESMIQTIKQILRFYRGDIQFYSEIKRYILKYLQFDEQVLDQCLKKVLIVDKKTDKFTFINDNSEVCYHNLGRTFNCLSEHSKLDIIKYQRYISQEFLSQLFDYQKQILIKYFTDKVFLESFVQRIELDVEDINISKLTPYLHLYFQLFDFVIKLSYTDQNLFSENQIQNANQIPDILYSQENSIIIIKSLGNCLSKEQNQEISNEINNYISITLKQYKQSLNDFNQLKAHSFSKQIPQSEFQEITLPLLATQSTQDEQSFEANLNLQKQQKCCDETNDQLDQFKKQSLENIENGSDYHRI